MNHYNITENEGITESLYFRIPYAVTLSLIFIFSVVSGCFVCYVIKINNMMKKRIWFYFFMVAMADTSTSLFSIPIIIAANVNESILSIRWVCKLNKALMVFFGCWSLFTLATLSLYKCAIISRPIESFSKTVHYDIIIYLTVSLTLSLFFAISPLVGFSDYHYHKGRKFCVLRSEDATNDLIFSALCGTIVYFASLCIIIVSSVRIYLTINKQNKERRKISTCISAKNDSVTKMLLLLVAVFFTLWTPLLLYLLLGMAKVTLPPLYSHLSWLLVYMQGCVNPLIYFFRHTAFSAALGKFFHKQTVATNIDGEYSDFRKRTISGNNLAVISTTTHSSNHGDDHTTQSFTSV